MKRLIVYAFRKTVLGTFIASVRIIVAATAARGFGRIAAVKLATVIIELIAVHPAFIATFYDAFAVFANGKRVREVAVGVLCALIGVRVIVVVLRGDVGIVIIVVGFGIRGQAISAYATPSALTIGFPFTRLAADAIRTLVICRAVACVLAGHLVADFKLLIVFRGRAEGADTDFARFAKSVDVAGLLSVIARSGARTAPEPSGDHPKPR